MVVLAGRLGVVGDPSAGPSRFATKPRSSCQSLCPDALALRRLSDHCCSVGPRQTGEYRRFSRVAGEKRYGSDERVLPSPAQTEKICPGKASPLLFPISRGLFTPRSYPRSQCWRGSSQFRISSKTSGGGASSSGSYGAYPLFSSERVTSTSVRSLPSGSPSAGEWACHRL